MSEQTTTEAGSIDGAASVLDDGLAVFPVPAFLRSPENVQADAMLAKFTMHTPSGPTNCCVKHARQLEGLMRMLGAHTAATKAPDGAVCENCENETKAKSANVQAQGRCAALSRSVPWSAVLGKHTIDLLARRLATADFQEA